MTSPMTTVPLLCACTSVTSRLKGISASSLTESIWRSSTSRRERGEKGNAFRQPITSGLTVTVRYFLLEGSLVVAVPQLRTSEVVVLPTMSSDDVSLRGGRRGAGIWILVSVGGEETNSNAVPSL